LKILMQSLLRTFLASVIGVRGDIFE